jgi:hypothetical protein
VRVSGLTEGGHGPPGRRRQLLLIGYNFLEEPSAFHQRTHVNPQCNKIFLHETGTNFRTRYKTHLSDIKFDKENYKHCKMHSELPESKAENMRLPGMMKAIPTEQCLDTREQH